MERDPWKPWVTYALIALNVAAFAVELATGADWLWPTGSSVLAVGGDFAPLTLHGEPWRLVTSMFLHFGVLHLGVNMIALYQVRGAERLLGRTGFVTVYLVTGLLGGIVSLARSVPAASAGASGALFGVFGAYLGFLLVRRRAIDPAVWSKSMRGMAYFIAINLVISLQAHIDLRAHAGGFVSGIIAGAWLVSGANPVLRLARRSAAIAVVGLALTVAAVFALPVPRNDAWLGATGPLIDELTDVEAAFNAAGQRRQAGAITDAQLADIVEHDVIPRLQKVRADVAAETVPDGQRVLVADLARYLDAELATDSDLVAVGRGDAQAVGMLEQHRTARDAAYKALADELTRLRTE